MSTWKRIAQVEVTGCVAPPTVVEKSLGKNGVLPALASSAITLFNHSTARSTTFEELTTLSS
jgi:hypothetical protein